MSADERWPRENPPMMPDHPVRPDGLAPYAADSACPGPREYPEPLPAHRTAFQRDRDRLLHSVAFRRLASKTQVLLPEDGDQHRTRLTHTLEVAQIARSLARALRLDEDLAEALALAHDFGHGPFGHTGEAALDAVLEPWGGFDHNVQSLRIVVDLERRYLDFDGLNLTFTTLEGLAKRKGPQTEPSALLRAYDRRLGLHVDTRPGLEAQLAAIADDIAYNAHDLEDGLRAGLLDLAEAETVPIVAALRAELTRHHPGADPERLPFALARGLIDLFVTDALAETGRRLAEARPPDIEAVRRHPVPLAGLSAPMVAAEADLKAFLFARMYRHGQLMAERSRAYDRIARLTRRCLEEPAVLPAQWSGAAGRAADPAARARLVADFVAGLTDRQAMREYARIFDGPADFV